MSHIEVNFSFGQSYLHTLPPDEHRDFPIGYAGQRRDLPDHGLDRQRRRCHHQSRSRAQGVVGDALKEVVESQGGTGVDLGHGVGPEGIPNPDDKQKGSTETREADD